MAETSMKGKTVLVTGASGGIGLGLSIASRAVRLHHGSLIVENAHPGLRVSLVLPESANYQAAS